MTEMAIAERRRRLTPSFATLRKAAGLSHRELAEQLGLTPAAVYQWEYGTNAPTVSKLPALAEALGCSMDTLVLSLIQTRGREASGEV